MWITSYTPNSIEAQTERSVAKAIVLEAIDGIVLNNLLLDDGSGYRPFQPLVLTVNDSVAALPLVLPAGIHVLKLLGEWFDGSRLMILGDNLQAVRSVDASLTATQFAVSPQYYEGDGHPDVNPIAVGALNGARYKDRVNKFRYERSEGEWLQLAS